MKTEYILSKHRFYELKHFCLQYCEWKHIYDNADGWTGKGDTTSRDGIKRADILRNIELIEKCALLIDPIVLDYVIDDKLIIPADMRYSYRKFFWELSKRR